MPWPRKPKRSLLSRACSAVTAARSSRCPTPTARPGGIGCGAEYVATPYSWTAGPQRRPRTYASPPRLPSSASSRSRPALRSAYPNPRFANAGKPWQRSPDRRCKGWPRRPRKTKAPDIESCRASSAPSVEHWSHCQMRTDRGATRGSTAPAAAPTCSSRPRRTRWSRDTLAGRPRLPRPQWRARRATRRSNR